MTRARVNLKRAMNERVVPTLRALGFSVVPSGGPTWNDGDYFSRTIHGRQQIIRIARQKFGGGLGLNVGRQSPDGSFEYMRWHELGLSPEHLKYSSEDELTAAVERLLMFVDDAILPWLGAPAD
jgi:hypothetical protein